MKKSHLLVDNCDIPKTSTCCFSGYRPEKFTYPLHASSLEYGLLLGYINIYVLHSVEKGYATFLCGMAQGFDIICGETILRLKRHKGYEHIRLICTVIPRIVFMSATVLRPTMHHASRLICYYDGKSGGTAYTVDYCRKNNVEVINLAEKIKAARAY